LDGGALVESRAGEHSRERGTGRDLVVPGEGHLAHEIRMRRLEPRLALERGGESHHAALAAHANLMGEVTLAWDDEVTSRATLAGVLAGAGFHERPAAQ